MPTLGPVLRAARKGLGLKDSRHDVGVARRSHANPGAPFAHRPVLETLIGRQRAVVTADRQRHEVTMERRGVEVRARREPAESEIDAVRKQLFLAIQPNKFGPYAKSRPLDLLRLQYGVADEVRAGVAAATIDDVRVHAEAWDPRELLPIHVDAEPELVRAGCAGRQSAGYVGDVLGRKAQVVRDAGIPQQGSKPAPVAEHMIGRR